MIWKIVVLWHWLVRLNFMSVISMHYIHYDLSQFVVLNAALVCRLALLGLVKSATIGSINKWNLEREIMDGVKMKWLLRNKWLIKNLVWQNFNLLFDAIDSEKCFGYAIYYFKLARYVKLALYKHDLAQSGTKHLSSISCALWDKGCSGTILPSIEHNWLKWSCDKYNMQRENWLGFKSLRLGFKFRAYVQRFRVRFQV